jgi:hypothetical protein
LLCCCSALQFGWDARRPGEDCGKSTECVSQLAQAAYGVRALALFAHKGVEQLHWLFYANDDGEGFLPVSACLHVLVFVSVPTNCSFCAEQQQ